MDNLKLKFDPMENNTDLAEKFVEDKKAVLEILLGLIVGKEFKKCNTLLENKVTNEPLQPLETRLKLLAIKIEENAELFAQLEALHRGVPKADVKNYDIKLLTQYLTYLSESTDIVVNKSVIDMTTAPLAHLGLVAKDVRNLKETRVYYDKNTVAVFYLFLKLLRDAGIYHEIWCRGRGPEGEDITHVSPELDRGCAGVVAERSDLDSAVDAFLYSTTKYLWRLRRLFVQDSVYERFKQTIDWSCTKDDDRSGFKKLCSEIYEYQGKLFLFGYVGPVQEVADNCIVVEAYRTVKELLALLAKEAPFALSLWASDFSEAQEIAYGVSVPLVWINDYGKFDGPPRASQVVYNCLSQRTREVTVTSLKTVSLRQKTWSKLTTDERITRVNQALENLKSNEELKEYAIRFQRALVNMKTNKFVELGNGKMCIGIESPIELVCYRCPESNRSVGIEEMLRRMVCGSAVVWAFSVLDKGDEIDAEMFDSFENDGLPIAEAKSDDETEEENISKNVFYKTRVVYSHCGTIFAN